jgi:hypothetical protein
MATSTILQRIQNTGFCEYRILPGNTPSVVQVPLLTAPPPAIQVVVKPHSDQMIATLQTMVAELQAKLNLATQSAPVVEPVVAVEPVTVAPMPIRALTHHRQKIGLLTVLDF